VSTLAAVLAPGYGASPEQPIVRAMAERLTAEGILARAVEYSRRKPTEPFAQELADLRRTRDQLKAERIALVGRSFGGRVAARLAAAEPPAALVLLGHPIAPQGRPRPDDATAFTSVRCPTLVVQGDRDRLGPLDVLQQLASKNKVVTIHVLKGVGHNFGPRTREAVDYAATWLRAELDES
jgi:predicted alpha/beta-hydrolase family hydrolase